MLPNIKGKVCSGSFGKVISLHNVNALGSNKLIVHAVIRPLKAAGDLYVAVCFRGKHTVFVNRCNVWIVCRPSDAAFSSVCIAGIISIFSRAAHCTVRSTVRASKVVPHIELVLNCAAVKNLTRSCYADTDRQILLLEHIGVRGVVFQTTIGVDRSPVVTLRIEGHDLIGCIAAVIQSRLTRNRILRAYILKGVPAAEGAVILRLARLTAYTESVVQTRNCTGVVKAEVVVVGIILPVPSAVTARRPQLICVCGRIEVIRHTGRPLYDGLITPVGFVSAKSEQAGGIALEPAYRVCLAGLNTPPRGPNIRDLNLLSRHRLRLYFVCIV